MAQLKYTPLRQSSPTIHVPQQLQDCEFIFVRNDAVKKPLTPTYQGPFKVLKGSEKHLTIDRGSRTDSISIDRVKPAFLGKSPRETEPVSTHPEPSPASTTTQSQPSQPRQNHPPLHLGRPVLEGKSPSLRTSPLLLYEPSYLDARDFAAVFSRPRKQPGLRVGLRPWQRLTSESHSITTLQGSTHSTLCYCLPSETPAHSCSFQLTPAASSTPTASSSPQQLPAASSSHLRRSTDVPLPIPAPADDLIQYPLTSRAR
ncbi:unnamed protein product [Acanthosepion pharaonis]|uniref:Uncharacterized protein n=1 Tax=Acanthosepion pharaonis TaxID=158019 RepID=A0A812BRN2_ACAPH|nr:unnamed protein product [Sepia pharaonis]